MDPSDVLNESELEGSSLKTHTFSFGALCYWWMSALELLKCTAFILLFIFVTYLYVNHAFQIY